MGAKARKPVAVTLPPGWPEQRIFVAVADNGYWALGFSALHALDTLTSSHDTEAVVVRLPHGAHNPLVDEMGSIRWLGTSEQADPARRFRASVEGDSECDLCGHREIDWIEFGIGGES
jgi:hypothetical protein